MAEAKTVAYVAEPTGSRFAFTDSLGETVEIGATPVKVDAKDAAYLDQCPFVKRAGTSKSAAAGGGEEE